MTILWDRPNTGVWDMGIESVGVHTKGCCEATDGEQGRTEVERGLLVGLGPGAGLEEKGRSTM